MPRHILAYGSLRAFSSRGHNFGRFGAGSQVYLRDYMLPGWALFPVAGGVFPAICRSNPEHILKTELHQVTNEAFAGINSMEVGSGYTETGIYVDLDDGTNVRASLFYVYPEQLPRGAKRVQSGDWC